MCARNYSRNLRNRLSLITCRHSRYFRFTVTRMAAYMGAVMITGCGHRKPSRSYRLEG